MNSNANTLRLPARANGPSPSIDSNRNLLIIGANGSGKTRFAGQLVNDLGEKAFCMSPMAALYGSTPTVTHGAEPPGIDTVYERIQHDMPLLSPLSASERMSQFDKLMALLLGEEIVNLISYKVAHASDPGARINETKLDTVIRMWKDIFPGNDVLIEGGRLLFSRQLDGETRPPVRLSAGEKVVLYYIGAVLFAPQGGVIVVDSPGMFLHPSVIKRLWDMIEELRPDCRLVYTTHDLDFASSRTGAITCWVRDYNSAKNTWEYDLLPPDTELSDEMYLTILGDRRPVLFIEGEPQRSIDAHLYPLIFPDYTVKPLGSCDRVIESTRVFNSLASFHHLDSFGIVDRDRRSEKEVEYLRAKKILVADVAEVENLFMLEEVVRTVASSRHKNEDTAFARTKKALMAMFERELREQALMHTRHRVKHTVEHRIDRRFQNIGQLEGHLADLVTEINPRATYEDLCRQFHIMLKTGDYAGVLRVFNQKSMLSETNVWGICGTHDKNHYINTVMDLLRAGGNEAERLRKAIRGAFGIDSE